MKKWAIRADAIVKAFNGVKAQEKNVENRLTSIETSIKTDAQTSSSKIEITPFQHVKLTFKSFFQKSFMFNPRVIVMNAFMVMLVSVAANLSMKLSDLQDTKQKYEIMRHFYRKHEVINSNFMFLDTLFLNKDKNEEVIERMKKQNKER